MYRSNRTVANSRTLRRSTVLVNILRSCHRWMQRSRDPGGTYTCIPIRNFMQLERINIYIYRPSVMRFRLGSSAPRGSGRILQSTGERPGFLPVPPGTVPISAPYTCGARGRSYSFVLPHPLFPSVDNCKRAPDSLREKRINANYASPKFVLICFYTKSRDSITYPPPPHAPHE